MPSKDSSQKRTSDNNFWTLFQEEFLNKKHRISTSSLVGLLSHVSEKLDGAQVIWDFLVTEDGPQLNGIYTHNTFPIASKNQDCVWVNNQPNFNGMDILQMFNDNQEPLTTLISKALTIWPDAVGFKIYSELMHPSSGQTIRRGKSSIYTEDRPDLIGTYQVFQLYIFLPNKTKPIMVRPSSEPKMVELFKSVNTPDILIEGEFGPKFVEDLCNLLIQQYQRIEGGIIHINLPDGTQVGWKLRTGLTESGLVHESSMNGKFSDISVLDEDVQKILTSLIRMFEATASERKLQRARNPGNISVSNGGKKGKKNKNPIDTHSIRTVWTKIFTHQDFKSDFEAVKTDSQQVDAIRTHLLTSFKEQVIKEQITTLIDEDGSINPVVIKNIEGTTRNMGAFMSRR